MNKKGSALDIMEIAILLLLFSFTILIGYKITNSLNENFQANDLITARGKAASAKLDGMYAGVVDNSFLFLTIGLAIGAFVLAALVRVHPIFIVFYLIVLGFFIFICGIFSNIYTKAAAHSEFTALADNLIFISHIMQYLPFIIGVLGSVLAIVMFKQYQEVSQ